MFYVVFCNIIKFLILPICFKTLKEMYLGGKFSVYLIKWILAKIFSHYCIIMRPLT